MEVKIYTKEGIFEGILVERPKIYDQNIITIKLKNGYNIGIAKDRIIKIEYLSKETKEEKEEEEIIENPELTILTTGGTILSRVDYQTGGVIPSYSSKDLIKKFPEILEYYKRIRTRSLFSYYSEEFDDDLYIKLAKEIYKEILEKPEGIIIFHGTDTLHYSSGIISFMIQNLPIPIIFTASQRSSDRPSSDAYLNLLASVIFIKKTKFSEVGIVMHETIEDTKVYLLRGVRARKMHSTRRDAFKPINDLPIFRIYFPSKKIEKIGKLLQEKGEREPILYDKLEKKIYLVYYYPGMEEDILQYIYSKKPKAIILMGTGMGHISVIRRNYLNILKEMVKEVDVYMTTQTFSGETNPNVYYTGRILKSIGITYLKDMIPEIAYVKAKWAYGNFDNPKEIMLKNFVGEMSDRRCL